LMEHWAVPLLEVVPLGQAMQAVMPEPVWCVLAGQGVHWVPPVPELNLPAGQDVHLPVPPLLIWPAGHDTHWLEPEKPA